MSHICMYKFTFLCTHHTKTYIIYCLRCQPWNSKMLTFFNSWLRKRICLCSSNDFLNKKKCEQPNFIDTYYLYTNLKSAQIYTKVAICIYNFPQVKQKKKRQDRVSQVKDLRAYTRYQCVCVFWLRKYRTRLIYTNIHALTHQKSKLEHFNYIYNIYAWYMHVWQTKYIQIKAEERSHRARTRTLSAYINCFA